jgi:hypothetical protein
MATLLWHASFQGQAVPIPSTAYKIAIKYVKLHFYLKYAFKCPVLVVRYSIHKHPSFSSCRRICFKILKHPHKPISKQQPHAFFAKPWHTPTYHCMPTYTHVHANTVFAYMHPWWHPPRRSLLSAPTGLPWRSTAALKLEFTAAVATRASSQNLKAWPRGLWGPRGVSSVRGTDPGSPYTAKGLDRRSYMQRCGIGKCQ